MKKVSNNSEVLTANELAQRLGVDRRTVIKEARKNKYPSFKMGSRWRFYWPAVEEALRGKTEAHK